MLTLSRKTQGFKEALIRKEVIVMARMLSLIPRRRSMFPADRFFDRFFDDSGLGSFPGEERAYVPAFDISENENEYVVKAELPGIDANALDIQFSNGVLTVKGEKKQEKEDKGENYHCVERRYGSFHRSFRIPEHLHADKIDANYKDGILTLTLPKDERGKTKKIEVKH